MAFDTLTMQINHYNRKQINMDSQALFSVILIHIHIINKNYGYSVKSFDRENGSNAMRTKRVVWGEPLLDRQSYHLMKYVVYINNGRTCLPASSRKPLKKPMLQRICEPFSAGYLHCGGVLLRDYIVQTACHCVSLFSVKNSTYSTTNRRVVWEANFVLYHGTFDTKKMVDGTKALQFFHHEKCHKYLYNNRYLISHDFGLIFTRKPLVKSGWNVEEVIAPLYAAKELTRMYVEIQRRETVCLIVGWGDYRFLNGTWERTGITGEDSQYLQHAWVRILPWYATYKEYFSNETFRDTLLKLYNVTYKDIQSWVGGKSFGKFRGISTRGDSGCPITCNDFHVGSVTGGRVKYNVSRHRFPGFIARFSSTSFSMFENAAEYRRDFLLRIARTVKNETGSEVMHVFDSYTQKTQSHGSYLTVGIRVILTYLFYCVNVFVLKII